MSTMFILGLTPENLKINIIHLQHFLFWLIWLFCRYTMGGLLMKMTWLPGWDLTSRLICTIPSPWTHCSTKLLLVSNCRIAWTDNRLRIKQKIQCRDVNICPFQSNLNIDALKMPWILLTSIHLNSKWNKLIHTVYTAKVTLCIKWLFVLCNKI